MPHKTTQRNALNTQHSVTLISLTQTNERPSCLSTHTHTYVHARSRPLTAASETNKQERLLLRLLLLQRLLLLTFYCVHASASETSSHELHVSYCHRCGVAATSTATWDHWLHICVWNLLVCVLAVCVRARVCLCVWETTKRSAWNELLTGRRRRRRRHCLCVAKAAASASHGFCIAP